MSQKDEAHLPSQLANWFSRSTKLVHEFSELRSKIHFETVSYISTSRLFVLNSLLSVSPESGAAALTLGRRKVSSIDTQIFGRQLKF